MLHPLARRRTEASSFVLPDESALKPNLLYRSVCAAPSVVSLAVLPLLLDSGSSLLSFLIPFLISFLISAGIGVVFGYFPAARRAPRTDRGAAP